MCRAKIRNGAAWLSASGLARYGSSTRSRRRVTSAGRATQLVSTISTSSLFVSALDDHILLYTLLASGRPSRPRAFNRRTIGHLGSVGFIQMLRVDTGMGR